MYRRMNPKQLEKQLRILKDWKDMKELLPEEFRSRYLTNGKLSDLETKSEYERGFIDCWNVMTNHCP
jgi:hypothetical protein